MCVCVCAQVLSWRALSFPLFVSLQTISPPILLHHSSIVGERILLSFPFTHLLSLFLSSSTLLITHIPQTGPSFRAFEVILAQILLSDTADKTRGGCLWGPLYMHVSVYAYRSVLFFLSIESPLSPVSYVFTSKWMCIQERPTERVVCVCRGVCVYYMFCLN